MENLCLICKNEFVEGDELINCPECGRPYHLKCFRMTGCCADPECREKTNAKKEAEEQRKKEELHKEKEAEAESTEAPAPQPAEMRCSKCGEEITANQKFCPSCGTPLTASAAAQAEKPIYKRTVFWAVCGAIVLAAVIIAIAAGGGKSASDGDVVQKIEESTTEQNTYEYDYDTADSVYDDIETTTEVETTEPEIPVIKKGQKITIDGVCQFFVDYTNITKDVMPKVPADYYRHYVADSGSTYVDICVSYKNLENVAVGADDVGNAVLYYDDKYQYTSFSCIEEKNRGSFTYSNITNIDPLTTEYLHYLIEVPDEVVKSGKNMDVYLSFGEDNLYRINMK